VLPLSSVTSIRVRGDLEFELGGIGTLTILPGPFLERGRFTSVGIREAVMNRGELYVYVRRS